jgi:2-polyprenyl-6-methoxyphenol hydroxylase-like FAD-dependent oxidoreductase
MSATFLFDHTSATYDVVVAGAGPSGLTLAASLARAGASVLVLEKHPGLSIFPKATGLRPRTMEILRSWGLESAVVEDSSPAQLTMLITPRLGMPGTEVSLGLPSDEELRALSPSGIAFYPQDRLEQLLLDHVLERGGDVRFSTRLVGFDQGRDCVHVTIEPTGGGEAQLVRGRYLVGADGARSTVREQLGVQLEPLGSEGHNLGVLFRADLSSVTPQVPHALTYVVTPGLEGMFAATGQPPLWMYHLEWHPERGETLADWPRARLEERIRGASGLPALQLQTLGVFAWEFGAAVALRQRVDRVFLVGDAGHRTTPRGATGMNTGIAGAHNLGWKLAWVVRGWAGPALLDSYEQERAPVGRANAEASMLTSPGDSSESSLHSDLGVRYSSTATLGATGLVGLRAPHAWVTHHGVRISTIDLFDGQLTVLTGGDDHTWRAQVAELASAGVPIQALSVGHELADPDGSFGAVYDMGAAGCVLVRPDGTVAWQCVPHASPNGRQLERVVQHVIGRLPAGEQPHFAIRGS